jgi:hypothetical protein
VDPVSVSRDAVEAATSPALAAPAVCGSAVAAGGGAAAAADIDAAGRPAAVGGGGGEFGVEAVVSWTWHVRDVLQSR